MFHVGGHGTLSGFANACSLTAPPPLAAAPSGMSASALRTQETRGSATWLAHIMMKVYERDTCVSLSEGKTFCVL